MKRNEWKFTYPATKLHEAAQAKMKYHEERLAFWTEQLNKTKEKIKSEGIEIDESLAEDAKAPAMRMSAVSNYGRQPSAQIRNDLLNDLNETVEKRIEHRNKLKKYSAWSQVMDSQRSAGHAYELTQDDWMFFFGR